MKLYYTVSSAPESVQTKPSNSLGGFKSANALINSKFGNLFGDITIMTVAHFNQNKYIGLVLKNETGFAITGVKMWFEYPTDSYTKLKVAAVDMVANASGDLFMEHIDSQISQPLYAEFFEANGVDNAQALGDLAKDEQIGIWIERELLLDFIKTDQELVYESEGGTIPGRYKAIEKNKIDDVKLGLSWD